MNKDKLQTLVLSDAKLMIIYRKGYVHGRDNRKNQSKNYEGNEKIAYQFGYNEGVRDL